METLESRIQKIEERNARVEMDKAWETSSERKIILIITTYIVVGIAFRAIGVSRPWINAIIPAAAFFVSTLTMSIFKKRWTKRHNTIKP